MVSLFVKMAENKRKKKKILKNKMEAKIFIFTKFQIIPETAGSVQTAQLREIRV